MKNNAYHHAKIGGIAIIICIIFCFIWSTTSYSMPSFSGILTLVFAAGFIYFTLKASNLLRDLEEEKNRVSRK
ncbi:MAG: hypothetical protein IJ969_00470 [Anaerotignum sp.]|nr:hypothetical protein [Anaerotignum sp.]MBR2061773.1 hypothetical protein [Anaerotignum sp.]MBR2383735.1 hypothetical protein [Anaerotignum sp.]MBR2851755.1 hypothetical protein [Anaerotignum sp.]MBR3910350.1 hypothetical protein [Anaerotignum sp.]